MKLCSPAGTRPVKRAANHAMRMANSATIDHSSEDDQVRYHEQLAEEHRQPVALEVVGDDHLYGMWHA